MERRIKNAVIWGFSAMVGYIIADKLYENGMKLIEQNVIEQDQTENIETIEEPA